MREKRGPKRVKCCVKVKEHEKGRRPRNSTSRSAQVMVVSVGMVVTTARLQGVNMTSGLKKKKKGKKKKKRPA